MMYICIVFPSNGESILLSWQVCKLEIQLMIQLGVGGCYLGHRGMLPWA